MLGVLTQRTRTVIDGASASSHHGLDGAPGAIAGHHVGHVGFCKADSSVHSAELSVFGNGVSCKAGIGIKVGYVLEAAQGGLSGFFQLKSLDGGGHPRSKDAGN